jgi:hypothetical protein
MIDEELGGAIRVLELEKRLVDGLDLAVRDKG